MINLNGDLESVNKFTDLLLRFQKCKLRCEQCWEKNCDFCFREFLSLFITFDDERN